jgi:hypothetical protein
MTDLNIIEFIKIRLSYLIELSKIVNNDLFNHITINHHNANDYDEMCLKYDIIKTNNNKIVCIDDNFKTIDLNEFSLNQIALMKIKYSSFNLVFTDNINEITTDYIIKLKLDINQIRNQIKNYHTNLKSFDNYSKELTYINNLILTDKSNLTKYFTTNMKNLLSKAENTYILVEKMKIISDIYSLVYNMFNIIITLGHKFKKMSYNQINRNRVDLLKVIYNNIKNNFINNTNIDIIYKYYKILIIVKILYMKTYNKEELDSYTLEYNYKDNLLEEEMKFADIIDNHLI